MRSTSNRFLLTAIILGINVSAVAMPHMRRGPASPRPIRTKPQVHVGPHIAVRQMSTERATELQSALIQSHYLVGVPSGVWDTETQNAMQKLQADNGWQTKLTPDSRAIIKLGLGSSSAPATFSTVNASTDATTSTSSAGHESGPEASSNR